MNHMRSIADDFDVELAAIWKDVLGTHVDVDDDFFSLGGNSVQAAIIMNRLQEKFHTVFHPAIIFDAPTITKLVAHLRRNYSQSLGNERETGGSVDKLTEREIEIARQHLQAREASDEIRIDDAARNGPAIFILSPPRSGSTLLRVMLGGHPRIFSPPELYLLGFNTLQERRSKLSGRFAFFREGLVRAVMQLRGFSADAAENLVATAENDGTTTHEFFRRLQSWAPGKLLVDKTPGYALHPQVLARAEAEFENALFIHLVRHPMATIASFEDVRVDLVTGDERDPLPESAKKRGELWWLISHENILSFLQTVPQERQVRIHYEDLVGKPESTVRTLCDRSRIDFHSAMLDPYADKKDRMTDGLTPVSRMLGDQKFHFYERIEAERSDDWRRRYKTDFLCDRTWTRAEAFGYTRESFAEDDEREQFEI